MQRIFVADTNLFFECRRLEDLPWGELDAEVVVIALTKPVLSEIDKHKRSSGRTRKRALETFGRVRDMLTAGETDTIVRDTAPQVILRLVPKLRPDQSFDDILDYRVNDDQIVGIAFAIAQQNSGTPVALLTDDVGAAATAQSIGLEFVLIDASWKRPPEQTSEAKVIAGLKKELDAYQAQEPDIRVRNAAADEAPTTAVRRVPRALPKETIDYLIGRLEAGYPPHTDWTVPENETHAGGAVITYKPADPEDIETYLTESYPNWLATCRSILETLHEGRAEPEGVITLTFGVSNKGSRPATKMRITFEARGAVMIERPRSDKEPRREGAAIVAPRPMPTLPKPPQPPKWSRAVSKSACSANDVNHAALDIAAQQKLLLDSNMAKALRTPDHSVVAALGHPGLRALFDSSRAVERFVGPQSELAALVSGSRLDPARLGVESMLIDPAHFRSILPEKHDPEGFYAQNWPRGEPTLFGALVCDLFRHQSTEEFFVVNVIFPEEGDVTGVVICTAHAENLTKPIQKKILVGRAIEEVDLTDVATDLVTKCIENPF